MAGDVALAIEAVPNGLVVKRDVLGRLLDTSDAVTVVATTSLAMPVSMLVDVPSAAGRVVGYHFMNPAPALRLCELVVPVGAADSTVEWSRKFLGGLGVVVVEVDDRPGFALNRTHVPFLLGAIERVQEGMSPDDVDSLFVIGCRHPMGPLATVDLVGLDVVLAIADVLAADEGARFVAPTCSGRWSRRGSSGGSRAAGSLCMLPLTAAASRPIILTVRLITNVLRGVMGLTVGDIPRIHARATHRSLPTSMVRFG